jgi:hypothetical protein
MMIPLVKSKSHKSPFFQPFSHGCCFLQSWPGAIAGAAWAVPKDACGEAVSVCQWKNDSLWISMDFMVMSKSFF